ncbi:hypothetical protein GCM10010216_38780 [Streptomyces flaveolus]|nr:hypothetical protein GCM10010216_38780 [Streptomyces flaveolus]
MHTDHKHPAHASHLHKHTFECPKGGLGQGLWTGGGAFARVLRATPERSGAYWCSTPGAGRLHPAGPGSRHGRTLEHDTSRYRAPRGAMVRQTDAHEGAAA